MAKREKQGRTDKNYSCCRGITIYRTTSSRMPPIKKKKQNAGEKTPMDTHKAKERASIVVLTVDFLQDSDGKQRKALPGNLNITDYAIEKLQGLIQAPTAARFFNDEVLNFGFIYEAGKYPQNILDRSFRVLPTTFFTALTTPYHGSGTIEEEQDNYLDAYCRVINYLKNYDYFGLDWAFIPINDENGIHWSAAIVVRPNSLLSPSTSPHACRVLHVDSSSGIHDTEVIGKVLKHYILQAFFDDRNAEERDKHNEMKMRRTIAEIEVCRVKATSQQTNGSDCGAYVDIFFERLMKAYKQSIDVGEPFTLDANTKIFSDIEAREVEQLRSTLHMELTGRLKKAAAEVAKAAENS